MKLPNRTTTALFLLLVPTQAFAQDVGGAAKILEFFQGKGVPWALLYIALAILLLRGLSIATKRIGERYRDRRLLIQQVSTIARFLTYIFAVYMVISSLFKLDQKAVLALGGASAVAIGFALKDLAASVIAGFTILFDRPFQVGDRVTIAGEYGEVTAIGLRSTRLVTLDDSLVTIPNNKLLTEVVRSGNAGALDMQVVIDFFIDPAAETKRAKKIVNEALQTSRFVYLEKPVVVLVNDVILESYVATRLRAKAYVLDVRYEKQFETDVTERVKAGFARAGIQPPYMRHLSSHARETS